jgi:hypothetical protein
VKEEAKAAQLTMPPPKAEAAEEPASRGKKSAKRKDRKPEYFTAVAPRPPGDAKKNGKDKKKAD